jgi:hypothetical protein
MPDLSASAEPGGTSPEPDMAADTTETPPTFANRATRRAHARGTVPRQSPGAAGQFGRKGTIQSPRQWGNRRSG